MTTRRIPLRDLVASKAVLSRKALAALLATDGPSGVAYDGPPGLPFPLLPLQIFGVRYDLDLVLVDDDPAWDMHEYARVQTADGPVWLIKDTVDGTLEQTIVADVPDVQRWLPEVPLRRRQARVEVDDRSDARDLDLRIAYENFAGVPVEVRYRGRRPKPVAARNSSTMGHSRDQVLVVLDVSARGFAKEASIAYAGRPARLQRILGLVPFAVCLVQTQAGFSIGRFVQRDEGGVRTLHDSGADQAWRTEEDADTVTLVQEAPQRTLRYVFRKVGAALELTRAEAWPAVGDVPACVARFVPALPDLRCPFRGPWEGRYVLDVDGQAAHGVGRVRVDRDVDADRIRLLPDAPRWTLDRPMVVAVRRSGATAEVTVAREEAP